MRLFKTAALALTLVSGYLGFAAAPASAAPTQREGVVHATNSLLASAEYTGYRRYYGRPVVYRRVVRRPIYYSRPVVYRRVVRRPVYYARPVVYRRVVRRPVYYSRPVVYRRVVRRPVYYGRPAFYGRPVMYRRF